MLSKSNYFFFTISSRYQRHRQVSGNLIVYRGHQFTLHKLKTLGG